MIGRTGRGDSDRMVERVLDYVSKEKVFLNVDIKGVNI